MYNMAVDKGLDGKSPGTSYSGPATFSDARGGTLIVLWDSSTFTTKLVELFRQTRLSAPITCLIFSLAQSAVKTGQTPTNFVVTDHFTDPTSALAGDIKITALSDTSMTATMNYHDNVHTVAASFNAIRQ